MTTIDADRFKQATGNAPVNDDLERSNCPQAGHIGHWGCGWDEEANLPVFMTGRLNIDRAPTVDSSEGVVAALTEKGD